MSKSLMFKELGRGRGSGGISRKPLGGRGLGEPGLTRLLPEVNFFAIGNPLFIPIRWIE